MNPTITFKIAGTRDEFESIHALNYRTFVEEIPQHAPNPARRLVDRFHTENTYLIAVANGRLAGMVALRARRPFSLDAKIPDLDKHLPRSRRWVEIRLLALEKEWRGTALFAGLMRSLEREVTARGYDAAVVSATTRQRRLYEHLGFEPFALPVGRPGAWYQPMQVALDRFRRCLARRPDRPLVNLLPGPVALSPAVLAAFRREPESHRSKRSLDRVRECRDALCAMTGATNAALLPGGGTLANEVVAAQIGSWEAPGVVASHGEFGERLADHARRAHLPHHHHRQAWGEPLELEAIAARLDARPETRWLWAAHCETSTGAVTPIKALLAICEPRGVRLCLDCVSSLSTLPVDLRRVHLASGTSGKGLAAIPGVGIVFHRESVAPAPENWPRALDLGLYARGEGVPFTLSTNLVAALHTALLRTDWPAKLARASEIGARLRDELLTRQVKLVYPRATTVLTVAVPSGRSATTIAGQLERSGWLVAANSRYLRERDWLQICLMGELNAADLNGLAQTLADLLFRPA